MDDKQAAALVNPGNSKSGPHFFRVWLPYLFQRIEVVGKKHAFLPLNRDYKPLGVITRDHLDYDVFAQSHGVAFSRDPAAFDGIWRNNQGDQLWLYSDSPASRADYFQRLERLMSKTVSLLTVRR